MINNSAGGTGLEGSRSHSARRPDVDAQGWNADAGEEAKMRWDGTKWISFTAHSKERGGQGVDGRPHADDRNQPPVALDRSDEWGAAPSPAAPPRQASPSEPRRGSPIGDHPHVTPHEARQGADLGREDRRAGVLVVRGTARAVQQRSSGGQVSTEVLSFRLERYDSKGERLRPVPVVLRGNMIVGGSRIAGQLNDGDEVEVRGVLQDGTLRADAVVNLTTGAHLSSRSGLQDLSDALSGKAGKKFRKRLIISLSLIASVIAVVITAFVLVVYFAQDSFEQQVDQNNSQFERNKKEALRNFCMNVRDNGMKLPHECDGIL